ncbi:hypothetical protein [Cellvibrio sp. PSBB006]|uniref:hypothetical protein n=1 Tax=Cellvibrio sp. PSBB006 TaxID=1987723 RepID=UPI000B3B3C4C|nr:hypothetical protein [Cellvibrio sp. PSBB006]ARU27940.1 hypothetical protein CBR65_11160 [Cellvibrio sp. PSBB006]
MARLTKGQKEFIKERTISFFENLLSFHVAYQAAQLLHNNAQENWREFEDFLHMDYPIKGIGIKATRKNLDEPDEDWGGFLHSQEPLSPAHVAPELSYYPLEAASSAYIYTLLENFGNEISENVNPGGLKNRQAWHYGVHGDLNISDEKTVDKAKKGFAKSFSVAERKITKTAIKRLVLLKSARNEFMHEGSYSCEFSEFFQCSIQTVCHIYFMLLPSEKDISVYPYEDFNGKWKNSKK